MKIITFIFCVLTCWTFSQKSFVELSADLKVAEVGNLITFTVKSNIEGNVKISFPDEFAIGYGVMNGMEQEADYTTGQVLTYYYYSQNGAFKEDGTYKIQAFVDTKNKVYKSNVLTIKIQKKEIVKEDISQKTLNEPIFGIIEKSRTKIFEGESIVLTAKTYSKLNINMLEGYKSFELEGGSESFDIENTQRLTMNQENFKGSSFYTFTYGKQVVFPISTGKIAVKPFEMSLRYDAGRLFSERISFTSNTSFIEVIPLPNNAPKNFIGGVGKFKIDRKITKQNIKQGNVFPMEIIISGIGNLQNIHPPRLNLPNHLNLYGDPEIIEEIEYTNLGAEGRKIFKYNIQVLESGAIEIPAISISYFDPELKKYITITEKEIQLDVEKSMDFHANIPTKDVQETNELTGKIHGLIDLKSSTKERYLINSPWFWTSFFSPMFLAFLGVFFVKRKEKALEKNQQKCIQKNKINEIHKLIENAEKNRHEEQNAFCYLNQALNLAVSCYLQTDNANYRKAEVLSMLKKKNIPEDLLSKIETALNTCDEARFSYSPMSDELDTTINQTKFIANQFFK
jgi:hypothetical protein